MNRLRHPVVPLLLLWVVIMGVVWDPGLWAFSAPMVDLPGAVLVAVGTLLATVGAFGWRAVWGAARALVGAEEGVGRPSQVLTWAGAASVTTGVLLCLVYFVVSLQVIGESGPTTWVARWGGALLAGLYGLVLALALWLGALATRGRGEAQQGRGWLPALGGLLLLPLVAAIWRSGTAVAILWLVDPYSLSVVASLALATALALRSLPWRDKPWLTAPWRMAAGAGAAAGGLLMGAIGWMRSFARPGAGDFGGLGPASAVLLLGGIYGLVSALILGAAALEASEEGPELDRVTRWTSLGLVGASSALFLAGMAEIALLLVIGVTTGFDGPGG